MGQKEQESHLPHVWVEGQRVWVELEQAEEKLPGLGVCPQGLPAKPSGAGTVKSGVSQLFVFMPLCVCFVFYVCFSLCVSNFLFKISNLI